MERNKKKRAAIRSSLTRFISKIEKELQENPEDADSMEELLAELKRKEESLVLLDREIEGTVEDESLEAELLAIEEYKEKISLWKTRIERLLKKRDNTSTPATQSGKSSIKLPRLTIDKFYGDSANWQNFWAQYASSIHKNENVGKVDKFNYLKSFVSGAAANAIAGLPLTEENYDSAVDILTARFGRRDLVINSHMNNLLSITPVKKSDGLAVLRKMYDACEVQIRSLEAMGVVSGTYSTLLCPILMKVIPEDIALEFSRRRDTDEDWKVSDLLAHLRKEIESRERSHQLTKSHEPEMTGDREIKNKSERCDYKKQGKSKYNAVPSASALNTSTEVNCLFCDRSDHQTEGCNRSVDEKRNILRKQGRCFICLKRSHLAKFCRSRMNCSNCNRRHNRTLCEEKITEKPGKSPMVLASISHQEQSRTIMFLQTAQALIKGNSCNVVVRCLLDSGSQRSFIRQDISRQLDLPVLGEETLKIHTFASNNPVTVTRSRVRVFLQNVRNHEGIEIEALESPEICGALIQIPSSEITSELISEGLQVADDPLIHTNANSYLTVIIGTDYYWKVVTGNVKRLRDTLVAVDTLFGWSIHGPTPVSVSTGVCESTNTMKVVTETVPFEEELASYQLKRFWELDSIGITDSQEATTNELDQEALNLFESSIKYDNGRYCISLPWKSGSKEMLADNKAVAENRFKGLVRKFQKNPLLYSQYREVVQEYLKDGIVQTVDNDEAESATYYLPHRAVVREEKTTTKIRIVFDASSKRGNEYSLNDCLFPGPNLNPDLFQLLLKFRENRIAFTADIEKAFLQIELAEGDRDFTRFLWTDNPFTDKLSMKVKVFKLTRVLFGVTSSPFLLAATIKHHLKKYIDEFPGACKMLDEALYVDDLISGADNEEDALKRSNETREIMKAAGMHLRKWQTNSEKLRDLWEKQGVGPDESIKPIIEQNTDLKVLGIAWNSQKDSFSFDTKQLMTFIVTRIDTKRFILQASGRIFDPVGFLSPFTMRVKCLFQQLWTEGVAWDDSLPEHIWQKWDLWCRELPDMNNIAVPRFYLTETPEASPREVQLHCFSDASEKAYGAVFYLRIVNKDGTIHTTFVCSKSRVAPLKRLTLPRLELMGALISARLNKIIKNCLCFNLTSKFWTDSTIVFYWIRGAPCRFKPFLENRITEIQSLTDPQEWCHCPGSENPADLLTRGCTVLDLVDNPLWWQGPPWLRLEQKAWPKGPEEKTEVVSELHELRAKYRETLQASTTTVECKEIEILDSEKFSSLNRILRITAWVKRFVYNVRNAENKLQGCLSAEELSLAEMHWIKGSQMKYYQAEVIALKHGKPIAPESKIFSLNPHLDANGILRVGGRIQHSGLSVSQRHPMILDGDSKIAELLIQTGHQRAMHGGIADTLTQVRERFWIPRGRQVVKKIVRKCFTCRKFTSKPATQMTAPLPKERIHETPPFQVTGIDFAGPLYTKGPRNPEKSYIALFTCAATRAVHLELVSDLSADKFLLAFRRFIARRGVCCTIFSDNAKTFKRAEKELKEMWKYANDQKFLDFLGKEGISWKYIVERAAWWGGFWERLIRSVKTCLKKVLGKAHLNFEEMITLLSEVEAVLNSRPLTYVYNNSSEPEPLTPAHFMVGGRLISAPLLLDPPGIISSTSIELKKRRSYRQLLLRRIWLRWRTQYLMDLRSAHHLTNTKEGLEIKKGDIVLVNDENKSKVMWKMGLVVDVFCGRDNKVRSCAVRLPNRIVIKRPVQLLYPLEVENY